MFAVYGVAGQSYRDSLEKRLAIPGLSAARRSRGIDQDRVELVGILARSDILHALVNDPPLSLWA